MLLLLLGPVGIVALLVVDRFLHAEADGLVPMTRAALAEAQARRRQWNGAALVAAAIAAAAGVLALTVPALPTATWLGVGAAGAVAALCWLTPARLGSPAGPTVGGAP